ncbi:MAG TPA: sigma-54 dependent transcriptional regulator [Acidobacteriaceae bacterium]|jgi:DNA-binding NtrC family response regulator|nr:sigma-54 dependent transcriptional regulator [Acidobacteriaceae bacterium]
MSDPVRIVIIDDHKGSLELLSAALRRDHLSIHIASSPAEGLELVRRIHPRLVITDLMMPGMNGLEVLSHIMSFDPTIDVVLMTAHYTTETAVEAIRGGAADYLQKPLKIPLLRERIATLLASAERRGRLAAGPAAHEFLFAGMSARSECMWELFSRIERIAPHFRSVLIGGPTGCGKDLVAGALHARSAARGPLVVLNCSAVSETLFESEIFGHVRGAFTGADRDKIGLFELASGGTLFLDEIGDMPLSTQAKLLRAVQNQEVLPVGSVTPRRVDVRVIAATHRDLRAAIAKGGFREDLFFRLSMVELRVPPLSERTGDISLLARFFTHKFAGEYNKSLSGITPRALAVLENYSWPGNVRELEHVIGRACMLADSDQIDVADLPEHLFQRTPSTPGSSPLADQERRLIERALADAHGNQSVAARTLGIGRDALRYKMRKFGLLSA